MPQRSRETSLSKWLMKGARSGAVLERVENSVNTGTPDIFGQWHNAFVCETKVYPHTLTGKQASFLRNWWRAGGRAWMLYERGGVKYLIHAKHCLPFVNAHPPLDDVVKLSMCRGLRATEFIERMATGGK